MSDIINGKVEYVNSREFNGKTFWNIKVGGTYYGCGAKKPSVDKGDVVSFQAKQNDKGYWQVEGAIKKGEPAPQRASSVSTPVATGRDSYWEQKAVDDKIKDKYIRACWAIQEANKFALAAQAQGLIAIPAKAKPEQIREQVLTLADELATVFLSRVEALASGNKPGPVDENTLPENEDTGEESDDDNFE